MIINVAFASIFIIGAFKDSEKSVKETGITFVSGHFLAFFILPLAIIVAAALGINGKLDSGVSAIIGAVVTYIVQKVTVR